MNANLATPSDYIKIYISDIPETNKNDICTMCQYKLDPSRNEEDTLDPEHSIDHLTLYQIANCGHIFHKDCITEYRKSDIKCPNCRTNFFGKKVRKPRSRKKSPKSKKKIYH